MSSVTNNTVSNSELSAALANITKYLGDAEKNNVKADKNVLNHFLTIVQQYENQQQTDKASAPAIPAPPGTLAGDLKNGINVFGSSNEINISYIVSLVLALTSLESEQLAKQFELQTAANMLQFKAGVAAADDAQAAAVAAAAGSFTSAGLSIASLGLEALGAYKANSAGNAAAADLSEAGEDSAGSLSKEVDESQDGTETKSSNEYELQNLGGNRSSSTLENTGETETELQDTKNQNKATTADDQEGSERVNESASRTRQNVSQTQRTASLNAAEATEAETSFNTPESTETSESVTPKPDQNIANQTTNPRAGTSDDVRNSELNSTEKTADEEKTGSAQKTDKSKAPSDFEKLAQDLRKAIRPDLEQKVTKLDKLRAYDTAYERVNFRYSMGARGLQAAANSAQGAGQLAQGSLTKLQLVEQANAQLNSASSQSASQTIQQLQEVINNARNLVNGLLQSEFSVSRSA